MTTLELKVNLPDQLARDVQEAGLLSAAHLERWLREQLQSQRVDEFFSAVQLMSAAPEPDVMSPEQVAEEIRLLRASREKT